ncbi:MAG: hypothetical protein JSS51_09255 [Planctomycetes bacterium]|nr:hypothetical protein [Planctomycetota bacterium]
MFSDSADLAPPAAASPTPRPCFAPDWTRVDELRSQSRGAVEVHHELARSIICQSCPALALCLGLTEKLT